MTRTEIGPRQVLRLNEKEKQFLKTGDVPGTYSQQSIEARIEEKARLLSIRFELLVEDIELLNDASPSTVPFECQRDCWFSLLGLEHDPTDDEIEQACTYTYSDGPSYPTSGLVEFGEQLGQLADEFYLHHDSLDEEVIQIILGFIYGLYPLVNGEPAAYRSGDYRREALDLVTRTLSDQAEILAEIEDEGKEKVSEYRDETERNTEEAEEKIETILNESGVKPAPEPFSIIEKFKERTGRAPGRRGPLSDGPFNPRLGEIGPDVQVEETFTTETVLAIVEEERLREKIVVHRTVREDFEELLDSRWSGVEAIALLACVHQADRAVMSSAQINQQLDSQKDYKNFIAKLAKDLSGRESPWDDRPLLEKRDRGWSLTKYGEVIGESIDDRYSVVGDPTPRPGATSEERIEAALSELHALTSEKLDPL